MSSTTFATGLRCLKCGERSDLSLEAYTCTHCSAGDGDPGVLDVTYDHASAAAAFPPRNRHAGSGVFRYGALLPVGPADFLLPAGATPLVPAPRLARRLGLRRLLLKDDTRSATRCFKDRATAVALSIAATLGRRDLYCASAGNAAISLAGFCAHAGLGCHVFVPARASATRLAALRRYGADVTVSSGDYDQAFAEAEAAGKANGWYSRNCALNPFLVEGKKTAAFEIAEAMEWEVPDYVVAPVGDGCILASMGKGFRELREMGITDAVPRLVGVQSEGVHPLVARWSGLREPPVGYSDAASIAVRRPRNALRLLAELAGSDGRMLTVSDAAMGRAGRALAEEAGLIVELTTAATLAALELLAADGSLEGSTAVLLMTGGRVDSDA